MTLQRVPINNFRGGLNTRDGPFDLQPNESPDLLNVTISSLVGQLETRKGKTRLDTAGMPRKEINHSKQVVIGASGKRFLMLSIEGKVYAMTPGGEAKNLHEGTVGSIWDFEVYSDAAGKDWVYMGNGVDAMQKWDGEAAATVAWTATKGAIPLGGILCVWENRMFITYVGAHSQRVYFSEFSDPEATIAEYGFVDIRGSEEDLDAIQDLAVLGARLIVLKRRGVFFISSAVTMLNRHIGGPGVWGRFQCAELEDKLYFFNSQGIFATGGVNVTMETGSINNWFPENLDIAKLDNARMIATKDTYPRLLLSVRVPEEVGGKFSEDFKLIEMVPHINFRRIGGRRYLLLPAFMLHDIEATSLATWNPTGTEELIVGTGFATSTNYFPAIAVTDSFARADENPLNNAGKWLHYAMGEGGETSTVLKLHNNQVQGTALGVINNAVYQGAAIKSPQCTVRVSKQLTPLGFAQGVGLLTCVSGVSENWNGYWVEWANGYGNPFNNLLNVYKVTNGKEEKLAHLKGVKVPAEGDELGVTVTGGKIYVGIKPSGGSWELIMVVSDSTYTEGKCGVVTSNIGFSAGKEEGFAINNFSAEKWVSAGVETAAVSQLFHGTTDEGEPIPAHWTSAWLPIQEQEPKERIRRLNIQLSGEAEVEVFKDFEEIAAFQAPVPTAGAEEPNKYRFVRVRPETHGRYHQVRIKTPQHSSVGFQVNAMELAVRGGKEH